VILSVQVFVWTIFSLAGCGGGTGNIPVASVLTSGRITLSWNRVPGAAFYELYMSTSPGVTTLNSYKISNVTPPITITDLEPGTTYYFMVAVFSDSGESRKSKELSYTVADTEGFIEFGDIIVQSEPKDKSSQPAETPVSSAAAGKAAVKPSEPQVPAVPKGKAGSEIIICFGDSLTFGTGAGAGMDYPSQLAKMIGKPVINKGIPGDTTAGALRRLNRDVLSANPGTVLITLGGNDLKNGVSKNIAFRNLKYIVETIQARDAKVIIGGLKFPGMGRGFGQGYEDLAQRTGATLIPDIFAGIVDNLNLMSDAIHPNNEGYRIIARKFYNAMVPAKQANQAADRNTGQAATKQTGQAVTKKADQAATIKTGQAAINSGSQTRDITLAWDDVPNATSYNIYWSDSPKVTKQNGIKIEKVTNPYKMKDLKIGGKYYFIVTAVNESGESKASEEFSFTVGQ